MKVKFKNEVVSSIGTFKVNQEVDLNDEHIVKNWTEQGLIQPVEEKKVKSKAVDKK